MAYRIDPGEPLRDSVARVARDQLEKAIEIMYREPNGRHEAVHEARKRFKKLRGLYRLVRKDAPDFYAAENARLRDTAKSLSAVRDATALVETMDRLLKNQATKDNTATLSAIRHRLEARRDGIAESEADIDDKVAAAISACEDAIEAVDALKLPDKPKKASRIAAKGLARTYGRALAAFEAAQKTGKAEDWHELRKRMKYHWMHANLLRKIWPGEMKLRAAKAKEAADDLGDDHDLAVMEDLIGSEPRTIGRKEEIAILRKALEKESKRLRGKATETLDDLLSDPKKIVRKRIRALYRDAA